MYVSLLQGEMTTHIIYETPLQSMREFLVIDLGDDESQNMRHMSVISMMQHAWYIEMGMNKLPPDSAINLVMLTTT